MKPHRLANSLLEILYAGDAFRLVAQPGTVAVPRLQLLARLWVADEVNKATSLYDDLRRRVGGRVAAKLKMRQRREVGAGREGVEASIADVVVCQTKPAQIVEMRRFCHRPSVCLTVSAVPDPSHQAQ